MVCHAVGLLRVTVFARLTIFLFLVALHSLDVVNHKQVKWLQVQVHDSFGVDLMQAQQKVPSNDLDVSEVESFATCDQIFE